MSSDTPHDRTIIAATEAILALPDQLSPFEAVMALASATGIALQAAIHENAFPHGNVKKVFAMACAAIEEMACLPVTPEQAK